MLASQSLDGGCLVGGEVVADQVNVEFGRDGFVDGDQEFLELDGPVSGGAGRR